MLRRCVWSRNIKNGCSIYIYAISHLRVNKIWTCKLCQNRNVLHVQNLQPRCRRPWMLHCLCSTLQIVIFRGSLVRTDSAQSPVASLCELFVEPYVKAENSFNSWVNTNCWRNILVWRSYVRASQVYLYSTTNKVQRFLDLFISINCSTCFRRFLRPSSRTQNCTYSVWYCQTNTVVCCYRGWDGTAFHLIHDSSTQQYWFDNTRRCMYSFVLLMMDWGTTWNM
jgi:hypothetical protein